MIKKNNLNNKIKINAQSVFLCSGVRTYTLHLQFTPRSVFSMLRLETRPINVYENAYVNQDLDFNLIIIFF